MWRGSCSVISPLRSGSDLYVLIGVCAIILFGIIIFLLSNNLIVVYLIFISSMVPFVFTDHKNSTKSPIFIFLLVINITHHTIFSIIVSMANPILSDIHHMISAVFSQIT
jgi:hypothetical protein